MLHLNQILIFILEKMPEYRKKKKYPEVVISLDKGIKYLFEG
jgi:hypothetical protein